MVFRGFTGWGLEHNKSTALHIGLRLVVNTVVSSWSIRLHLTLMGVRLHMRKYIDASPISLMDQDGEITLHITKITHEGLKNNSVFLDFNKQ